MKDMTNQKFCAYPFCVFKGWNKKLIVQTKQFSIEPAIFKWTETNAVVGAMPEGDVAGVATVGPGVTVGDGAKIGPNAMVSSDVEGGAEVC